MSAKLAVYKSSAGSGKTYTLVRSYLQIVLDSPETFKSILALTFTNKAAFEMKSRIILYLNHIANPITFAQQSTVTQLMPDLSHRLGLSPDILTRRAQTCLRNILFQYDDFSVSTLDSFFNRVVKAFAWDLKVPLNYEIDLDENRIRKEAIQRMIARVGIDHDADLTQLLCDYTHEKITHEANSSIDTDFDSIAKVVDSEQALKYLPSIRSLAIKDYSILDKTLNQEQQEALGLLTQIGQKVMSYLEQHGLNAEDFFQGKRGIYKSWVDASQGIIPEFNSYARKSIDQDQWSSKTKHAEAHISPIKRLTQELLDWLNTHQATCILRQQIRKELTGIAVLSQVEQHIHEIKEQTGSLSISDLGKHISKIVSEESAPFIYLRLGERYKHFFIDEFQDTSILQWHNLLPLIDNSLSESHFNLIVGDAKQAIYRFRNGEVEQFANLPQLYPSPETALQREREQMLQLNYDEHFLNTNFRSHQEIVAFNNDLYEYLQQQLPDRFKGIYEHHAQDSLPDRGGAYVELRLIETNTPKDYKKQSFNHVLLNIQDLIRLGYDYRDIAILMPRNTLASEMAQYLAQADLPVLSTESLLLTRSSEVRLLIAMLRYLHNPDDTVAALSVLKICKASDIIQKDTFEIDKTHLERWHYLSLYDLCEDILRSFYPTALHDNAYIQSLLNFVYQKSQDHLNISEFLKVWDEHGQSLSIAMPDGLNAIQVMTIHKSKGLEFPIVFLPLMDIQSRMSRRYIWAESPLQSHPELGAVYLQANDILQETPLAPIWQEEYDKVVLDIANQLYVATTRAEQRLYISCKRPSKTERFATESLLINFASSRCGTAGGPTQTDWGYTWGQPKPVLGSSQTKAPEHTDEKCPRSLEVSGRWYDSLQVEHVAFPMSHSVIRGLEIHEALSAAPDGLSDPWIDRVIQHPELRSYFDPEVSRAVESELIDQQGRILRPDLVIFGSQETVLIDYKTGQAHERHQAQMRAYAEALQEMGYHQIVGILVYIGEEISLVKIHF